jgi:hypothetical protein
MLALRIMFLSGALEFQILNLEFRMINLGLRGKQIAFNEMIMMSDLY